MTPIYQYTTLRLARGRNVATRVASHLVGEGGTRLAEAGGSLYGLWAGQLGFSSDEAVLITVWPDERTARLNAEAHVSGSAAVVDATSECLVPTLRPKDPTPPTGPGMFVLRWFDIEADALPEVIRLSGEAWETFEKIYDARIFGLFRASQAEPGHARLLLITRYASYAVWEDSRSGDDPDAWKRFIRRHELTYSTVGRSAVLVPIRLT
jgi:hypothetical protein